MKWTHDTATFARAAAHWLLVVSVFFGPLGLGSAAAFSPTSKTCGSSCPCEESDHGNQQDEHAGHAEADPCDEANSNHEHDDPCQEECPDNCPKCSCCLGVAVAVLPLLTTTGLSSCSSSSLLAPGDEPANGFSTGVFRPPRSLT